MRGKRDEGQALIIVLIVTLIFVVLGTTLLLIWSSDMHEAKNDEEKLQAYYIARSGADAFGYYFENPPASKSNDDLKSDLDKIIMSESSNQQSESVPLGAGNFKLHVYRQPDNPRLINVEANAQVGNEQQQVTRVIEETPEVARNSDGSIIYNSDNSPHYNYTWVRKGWVFTSPLP